MKKLTGLWVIAIFGSLACGELVAGRWGGKPSGPRGGAKGRHDKYLFWLAPPLANLPDNAPRRRGPCRNTIGT